MGSPLGGRVCVPAHALDRIVGLPEPLTPSSFAMRSPLWVELAYLCSCSIVTKALTWTVLGFKFLRNGVTLLGSSVHTCICTRSEQRFLAMCSFMMGSPFYGRVAIPMYVLDRNKGFHLVCLALCSFAMRSPFQSRGSIPLCMYSIKTKVFTWLCLALCSFMMGHPFRVECPYFCMYSIGSKVLT